MNLGSHTLGLVELVNDMGILLSEVCTKGPELRRWHELRGRLVERVTAIRDDAQHELDLRERWERIGRE